MPVVMGPYTILSWDLKYFMTKILQQRMKSYN